MRSLHLTLVAFVHILLASLILYSQTFTSALPLEQAAKAPAAEVVKQQHQHQNQAPSAPVQPEKLQARSDVAKQVAAEVAPVVTPVAVQAPVSAPITPVAVSEPAPKPVVPAGAQAVPVAVHEPASKPVVPVAPVPAAAPPKEQPQVVAAAVAAAPVHVPVGQQVESKVETKPVAVSAQPAAAAPVQEAVVKPVEPVKASPILVEAPKPVVSEPVVVEHLRKVVLPTEAQYSSAKMAEQPIVKEESPAKKISQSEALKQSAVPSQPLLKPVELVPEVAKEASKQQVVRVESMSPVQTYAPAPKAKSSTPIVKGGLGPLHLLAATLCSYQPDKPVADEAQNLLYSRRAAVRKSLFDFMSLKFTNLERLSSRLNEGLEIVPPKTIDTSAATGSQPSHGWPVVGSCTAHDLRLMAEAAWCECSEEADCEKPKVPAVGQTIHEVISNLDKLNEEKPSITSNQHLNRAHAARSIQPAAEAPISPEKSAIIAKILHVGDIKDAPVVESTIASLNLTQQQLASIQAQATSTRECRRNALRMTKALLNHLAEDQSVVSESWSKLYTQMASDDCARKRMIDIIGALSSYRTEASSIRRDNMEFAFAMDDLRSKVLENEVNVPLTFDKQFIEVGQFMQQSVKLMLTNIDPERARLTSMRYRSLMPGPVSADDQCIQLHQRLLAKQYPTNCNPTQFGQLPDVLRMAASSLELWSIESELAKSSAKQLGPASQANQPQQAEPASCAYSQQQQVKQDLNECISNLVSY